MNAICFFDRSCANVSARDRRGLLISGSGDDKSRWGSNPTPPRSTPGAIGPAPAYPYWFGRRTQLTATPSLELAFPTLTPAEIDFLRSHAEQREYADGDVVFKAGAAAIPFFVVES